MDYRRRVRWLVWYTRKQPALLWFISSSSSVSVLSGESTKRPSRNCLSLSDRWYFLERPTRSTGLSRPEDVLWPPMFSLHLFIWSFWRASISFEVFGLFRLATDSLFIVFACLLAFARRRFERNFLLFILLYARELTCWELTCGVVPKDETWLFFSKI